MFIKVYVKVVRDWYVEMELVTVRLSFNAERKDKA